MFLYKQREKKELLMTNQVAKSRQSTPSKSDDTEALSRVDGYLEKLKRKSGAKLHFRTRKQTIPALFAGGAVPKTPSVEDSRSGRVANSRIRVQDFENPADSPLKIVQDLQCEPLIQVKIDHHSQTGQPPKARGVSRQTNQTARSLRKPFERQEKVGMNQNVKPIKHLGKQLMIKQQSLFLGQRGVAPNNRVIQYQVNSQAGGHHFLKHPNLKVLRPHHEAQLSAERGLNSYNPPLRPLEDSSFVCSSTLLGQGNRAAHLLSGQVSSHMGSPSPGKLKVDSAVGKRGLFEGQVVGKNFENFYLLDHAYPSPTDKDFLRGALTQRKKLSPHGHLKISQVGHSDKISALSQPFLLDGAEQLKRQWLVSQVSPQERASQLPISAESRELHTDKHALHHSQVVSHRVPAARKRSRATN
mmetsp:Transcript_18189/g.31135  ORF Transcript_18189/g.31135 Transcript_18189/m.31135 type:complete len:414 (+) Transcript_18189:698-1939(+)